MKKTLLGLVALGGIAGVLAYKLKQSQKTKIVCQDEDKPTFYEVPEACECGENCECNENCDCGEDCQCEHDCNCGQSESK